MKNLLIGICGTKGAGKDIAANMLQFIIHCYKWDYVPSFNDYKNNYYPIETVPILHFGDALKDCISIIFGIPRKDLDDRNKKDNLYYNVCDGNYKNESEIINLDTIIESLELNDKNFTNITYWYNKLFNSGHIYIKLRTLLQFIGTDIFHNIFSDRIWINATMKKITNHTIIADVRFKLEAFEIKIYKGFVITVINSKHNNKIHNDKHQSEIEIDSIKSDYSINWDGENKEILFFQLNEIVKNLVK